MRCARCGNENPETNRFCGMCGATLLQTPTPVAAGESAAAQTSTAAAVPTSPPPAPPARPAPISEPTISGPSFLGLNQPEPRKRSSLSIDPQSAPTSRSLDYLLDDEEEPRSGGAGKFILILIALALAVGFGYLRWKNQGFAWLNPGATKPSATQTSPGPDAETAATPTGSPNATNVPPAATANPPGVAALQPTPGSPASSPASTAAQSSPAASSATAGTIPPVAPVSNAPGSAGVPPAPVPATGSASSGGATNSANSAATPPAATSTDSSAAASDTAPPDKPKPAPTEAPAKPPAATKPAPPIDRVAEAQKYLYGRGVRQDCDRGLRILKPAADQANPKAMIEMGALYAAGLCTPHDLPTAYRWFALALRKDPDNQSVQTDLQKLWGEMTQPERQLAIKLSQ